MFGIKLRKVLTSRLPTGIQRISGTKVREEKCKYLSFRLI